LGGGVFGVVFGRVFKKVGQAQNVLLPRAYTTTAEEGMRGWCEDGLYGCFGFCGGGGGGGGGGLVMRRYEAYSAGRGKGVYEKRRDEKSKTPGLNTGT